MSVVKRGPRFESSDLNTIMAWYLTGKVTMSQLADELNARLDEKEGNVNDETATIT